MLTKQLRCTTCLTFKWLITQLLVASKGNDRPCRQLLLFLFLCKIINHSPIRVNKDNDVFCPNYCNYLPISGRLGMRERGKNYHFHLLLQILPFCHSHRAIFTQFHSKITQKHRQHKKTANHSIYSKPPLCSVRWCTLQTQALAIGGDWLANSALFRLCGWSAPAGWAAISWQAVAFPTCKKPGFPGKSVCSLKIVTKSGF